MINQWRTLFLLDLRSLLFAQTNDLLGIIVNLATFVALTSFAIFLIWTSARSNQAIWLRVLAVLLAVAGILNFLQFWHRGTPVQMVSLLSGTAFSVTIIGIASAAMAYFYRRKQSNDLQQSLEDTKGQLQREQYLLAALVENMPDSIYFKDLDSRFIRCNQKVADVFQLPSPADAVGTSDHNYFCKAEADEYRADELHIIQTGEPIINKEEYELWPDGEHHWVLSTKMPLRDSEQNIIGTFGLSRDISALKKAEQGLQQKIGELEKLHARYATEQSLFSSLIENIPDAVFFKDRECRFIRVNPAMAEDAGFASPEQMIGLTDKDVWGGTLSQQALADEQQIMETGEPIIGRQEEIVRKADGETRWVLATKMPLRNARGEIVGTFGLARDITTLKITQEWLCDSQERFELAVQGTNDGLWDWNVRNDEVWYAPRFLELLGIGYGDEFPAVLSSFTDRLHPDDRPRVVNSLETHLHNKTPHDEEYRLKTSTGDYRWFRGRGQATWNDVGEPLRMAGSIQDIDERRKTQDELARTKLQLEQALQGGNVGMWNWNVETNEVVVSPEFMGHVGGDMDNPWNSLEDLEKHTHPDDLEAARGRVWDYMEGRTDEYESSFRLRSADGNYRWILSRGRLFRNEEGQPGQFIGVHIDVSELREAEMALAESEARFRGIFNQTFQFIGLMSPDGTLIDANRTAMERAGVKPNEAFGKKFWDTIWWSHSPELQQRLKDAVKKAASGELDRFEATHPAADGSTVYVDFSLKPALNADGEIAYLIPEGHDVSELKKYEERLELRSEALEQSNRELEQFAYIASHDLQEPLRTIVGFCQLLELECGAALDKTGQGYIETIVDGGKRMQRLINDLLEYSRVSRHGSPLEKQSLNDVLEEVQALLYSAITESETTLEIGELPDLFIDTGQMIRVFQNLIGNSIKYRAETTPHVRIWADKSGNEWNIFVQDNGIGIPEEFAEQVFVIFKRLHTRDEYSGTGIGLAVCRRIVERHGGRIHLIHNQPNRSETGSTIQIVLPVTPPVDEVQS